MSAPRPGSWTFEPIHLDEPTAAFRQRLEGRWMFLDAMRAVNPPDGPGRSRAADCPHCPPGTHAFNLSAGLGCFGPVGPSGGTP